MAGMVATLIPGIADEITAALVASLVSGAIGFWTGWYFGRQRMHPSQHEALTRFVKQADVAIEMLHAGALADGPLHEMATIYTDLESIVPGGLLRRARGVQGDLMTVNDQTRIRRNAQRDQDENRKLAADHEVRKYLESGRRARADLMDAMRKHFGAGAPN